MASVIKDRILNDIKIAMKENHREKRDALRMLNSALKQVEVDERKVLEDKEVILILKKPINREQKQQRLINKQVERICIKKKIMKCKLLWNIYRSN